MQFISIQKRAFTWALIATIAAFVLWLLAPVLSPFTVAAILASSVSAVLLEAMRTRYLSMKLLKG